MKKTILILSILAFIASNCGNKKGKIPFDLATFPSEWRSLTKENGKLVVSDSPFEILKIDGNKLIRIYYARGEQSDFESEIVASYQIGDTIVISTKPTDAEFVWDYKFLWLDKNKGLGEWIFNADSEAVVFVVNERISEYSTENLKGLEEENFNFSDNTCYDYEGTLGEAPIQLSICMGENPDYLTGSYCYKSEDFTKYRLAGEFIGDKVQLTEYIENKPAGHFNGRLFTDNTDRFEGIYTNAGARQLEFKLTLTSSVGYTTPDERYSDFSASDKDVEKFMRQIKLSIAEGDKEWIANNIRYPLKTTLNGQGKITIKNKQQLIDNFEQIFHPAFKEQIEKHCVCNMFYNSQGIMLGNGEIWIGKNEIIAINNSN